jgi:LSD1 subclass zinc finger protein
MGTVLLSYNFSVDLVLEVLVQQILYEYKVLIYSCRTMLIYLQGTKERKCSSSRIVIFPLSQGKILFFRYIYLVRDFHGNTSCF